MDKDIYLSEDLDNIVREELIPWEEIRGRTVVVSGATGLIGSLLCKSLMEANRVRSLDLKLVALIRNPQKAADIYGDNIYDNNVRFLECDLIDGLSLESEVDYIIHCASITSSKKMIDSPVETIRVSLEGTRNMYELAKEKHVRSFVYVSSMEVYGSFANEEKDITESDMGYIDPLIIRSNYPLSKRMCENMGAAYYGEYGVSVKIARLAQTFGPGILPGENRVFAQFARSVISGKDIVLHTAGQSEGNYCYSADAIKGLLTIMLKGENGQAYNVVNPASHTTIAGMAEMVCNKIAENRIKVIYDIPEDNIYGFAADTKMKLNSDKLKSLGWTPQVGLEEAFSRLIGSMRCKS